MNLDSTARNLRVLWRADSIRAQIQLQHLLTRLGLRALAAVIAVFGLLSFELASYFALVQRWDAIWAAVVLGAINIVIALLIALWSNRTSPHHELHAATELHKSAVEALQADAAALQGEIASFKSNFVRPLDATLAALVIPAASLVIRALKKAKAG
jgi:uncharacterized membrane protein YqjE